MSCPPTTSCRPGSLSCCASHRRCPGGPDGLSAVRRTGPVTTSSSCRDAARPAHPGPGPGHGERRPYHAYRRQGRRVRRHSRFPECVRLAASPMTERDGSVLTLLRVRRRVQVRRHGVHLQPPDEVHGDRLAQARLLRAPPHLFLHLFQLAAALKPARCRAVHRHRQRCFRRLQEHHALLGQRRLCHRVQGVHRHGCL